MTTIYENPYIVQRFKAAKLRKRRVLMVRSKQFHYQYPEEDPGNLSHVGESNEKSVRFSDLVTVSTDSAWEDVTKLKGSR